MIEAGGLIKLHNHTNLNTVLEHFSDVNNILYYKNRPLFLSVSVSEKAHNKISFESDGLYVDGVFIDRFEYKNNELYFDNKIVSREYTDTQITNAVNEIWVSNGFNDLEKFDLSYWMEEIENTNKKIIYRNNNQYYPIKVKITNRGDMLYLTYNNASYTSTGGTFSVNPNNTISVRSYYDSDLDLDIEFVKE